MSDNKVVILIISHKSKLSDFETISIKQCFKILGNYNTVFVCPEGMDTSFYYRQFGQSITIHYIAKKWLCSYANFNRLKISPLLFKQYEKYDYILFYEPDAFVFKDELEYWCNQGYAYVGAPWLDGFSDATSESNFVGVGNGGFSLRNVTKHLEVLTQFRQIRSLDDFLRRYFEMNRRKRLLNSGMYVYNYLLGNFYHSAFNRFDGHEDDFWGNYAGKSFDWFNIPDPLTALKFSMEAQPKLMMGLNNYELPFGCHAWWKFDVNFWKPFIEEFGYELCL